MSQTAVVSGISGQTGAYLARQLLVKGYTVIGTSRNAAANDFWRLARMDIQDDIRLVDLDPGNKDAITGLLEEFSPDEIYYLAGPSSVAQSFAEPEAFMHKIFTPVLNFLDVLRTTGATSRFVNSSSTDCFGNQPNTLLD
jgi:GDPmannose 4,6-dehydratase